MTLENTRLDRAFAVVDALERPGADSKRISAALPSLSGFELTGAPDAVRSAVESFGIQYNALARRDPAESPETPVELNDEDARELAIHLRQVAELIRDVETDRILARLRDHGGVLPEAEVIEARRHQDWFVPHLMRECRDQIAKLSKLDNADERLPDDQDSSLPFLSLFLFSEWHVADSIPVILEGLSLPGEAPFELFGDAVHEQVPRYLAQLLPDHLDQIDALVSNPHVNVYVRWSSANSYKYLVRDQKISVDDAVARLDRLFHETKITADDGSPGWGHCYELSAGIVDVIYSIGGASRSAISADDQNWNFIDEWIIGRGEFDEPSGSADGGKAKDELLNLPPTRVEDCLEDLRGWAAFEHEQVPRPPAPRPSERRRPRVRPRPAVSRPSVASSPPAENKPIRRAARVPRNAPCPCGSGRKYKQCCLRNES